ncbi:glycoside hydrolase family 43 protein [Microbacterium sp. KUDC0406]|uniref:glycoside hydrolase family 43 protein n=1 Tax=Microbacterium sp. KUDC0406 TaxID=2909588 RepID=UPI001F1B6255|nr:glycoside hydrolase family 43 protein [Microbacterium sp. KUDC0406]UJP09997.1 glycoside hydrolase family 43 protein [Microbacterium sp. KUDC0406]
MTAPVRAAEPIGIRNPILPGCHPDPSICRAGEWYYLVTSTFEYLPGLPVLRSRDLLNWETIGHVIDRPGMLDFDGIGSSGGLYAPTIRHGLGLFWVVCTLVDRDDPARGGDFLVTADDPAGPWSDPIALHADGIDPSLAFDDDGRVWMHGTRLAADPEWPQQTEVWVREYSPAQRALVGEEHVIWRGAVRGAVWAEGPHLYRIDGRWHLIAAEGGTEFHHAVTSARAEHVTGPYTPNPANPVLTHRNLGRGPGVIGVGHADLVQAPGGSWHAVLLGMRTADGVHYPLGRETFLCPVDWQDGWPVLAPGAGRVPDRVTAPWATTAPAAGTWQPDGRRAGEVPPGDPRWTALRALPAEIARIDAGTWRMPVRPTTLQDAAAPAFLGIRQQHSDVDVRCTLDLSGLAVGERAGLVVRQSERDHVVLQVSRCADGDVLSVVRRRAGILQEGAEAAITAGPSVELVLRVRGYEYLFEHEGRILGSADGRELDAVATGGFLGIWIGVHASGDGPAPGARCA